MKNFFRNLMNGRNGVDEFDRFIAIVALIILVGGRLAGGFVTRITSTVGVVLLVYAYYRIFSRNLYRREAENRSYLNFKNKLLSRFKGIKTRAAQRKVYKFFNCPSCHTKVRVPKGKGKIQITCPKCNSKFIKNT